jgi:glycerophosphoryl diester phosphodiesterase
VSNPLLDASLHPVIGHRGNAAHAPENTLESFRQAAALGVDAIEFDVHLTGDGVVVVIHDPTLDRTTNGSGRVDRMAAAEVQQADAGARYTPDRGGTWPYRGKGITVPTLDGVLAAFPTTPLLIEVKAVAASHHVRDRIEAHGAEERCIVAAFDKEALVPFRGSRIATGASRRDTARLLPNALLRLPSPAADFDVMCMPPRYRGLPLPVSGYARVLKARGVPVHVWTIDDPAEAVWLWRKGVCGIISSDPHAMLQVRAGLQAQDGAATS